MAKAIPTLFLRPEVSLTDVAAIKQATDRTKQHLGASDVSMTLFHAHVQGSLWSLRIYAPGGKPAQVLDAAGDATVSAIFHIMIGEMGGDHTLTFDLIRNYLMKMHDSALKLQPSETLY